MRIMFSIIFYYIYFLSSASLKTHVLARRRTTNKNRLSFGPRKITSTIFVSLNSSSSSSVSSLPTSSDFFPEKDPRILEPSVVAISLIRGGQQRNGDYYDSKGYQNDSPPSSSSSSQQQQYSAGDDFDDGRYGGADDYDDHSFVDRGASYNDRDSGRRSFTMPDIIRKGNRKIGLPLLGIGAVLTLVGASLFFNKMLMRLGNVFFVAGVPMTIGPGRTAGYFFQPKKARATACLTLGIILVFIGWPILGIILEVFGFLNLFGNMFPFAFVILKQIPVIGPLLKGNFRKNNDDFSSRDYSRNSNQFDDYDDRYDGYQDRDRYDEDAYHNKAGYNEKDNSQYY